MADEILYCAGCGRRIPPEEAEADDFREEGGEPTCVLCLEKEAPGRKRKLAEVRSTRLRMRIQRAEALDLAQPPRQTYPPVGTESPRRPTDTAIAAVQADLDEDAEALDPAVAAAELQAAAAMVPRRRLSVWWALLVLGILAIATMLFWPMVPPAQQEVAGSQETAMPPQSETRVPQTAKQLEPKPLPPVQLALAEVELIRTQVGDYPEPAAAEVAITKLKQIALRADEPARSAALDACARYEIGLDAWARQTAREAAERAEDLAAQRLYDAAAEHLRLALNRLPPASVWAQGRGRERLQALVERWSTERRRQLSAFSARLESELAAGNSQNVEALVAELRKHPEKEFQELAQAYANQLDARRERDERRQREDEAAAQAAWPLFFQAYDTALASRDFKGALESCQPAADAPLRRGGVAQPDAVLAGFAEDVARVRGLFDQVLKAAAKKTGTHVQLRLVAGQVEGDLRGVDGGHLIVMAGNRIEVRVAPEKLSSEALATLLLDTPRADYGPGLAALRFAETSRDAEERSAALAALYQEIGRPLPVCWAQRFELERRLRWRDAVAPHLAALKKAVDSGQVPAIRDALTRLRPWLDGGALSLPERELLTTAEKLAGGGRVLQLVLQNTRFPSADFQGLRIDQISAYYKYADKCDVGLDQGLRLGSINDLQRILIRFDGLTAVLGRGRLIKATLEFHQLNSPASDGAVIALFPLARDWSPDASSWTDVDRTRKLTWEKPGASGPLDAGAQPVAKVTLDGQQGLWRSWDVTAYLRDVLEGKAPAYGLLMKVVQDEPKFGVRFYPDGEVMAAQKDPALRPRLVIEFEKFGP